MQAKQHVYDHWFKKDLIDLYLPLHHLKAKANKVFEYSKLNGGSTEYSTKFQIMFISQ